MEITRVSAAIGAHSSTGTKGVAAPEASALAASTAPSGLSVAATPESNHTAALPQRHPENSFLQEAVDPERLEQEIREAIERLDEQLKASAREIGFSVDKTTDQLVVSVFNKETGELVRQIPAEAVIRLSESLENLRGLLFDQEI